MVPGPAGEKSILWVGSSRDDIRGFPERARQDAGHELHKVQRGLTPSNWKPMKSVWARVREIKISADGEYRVLYVAQFAECVYVLHAFEKKSQRTPQSALELARRRLRKVQADRKAAR